jgi:hypothetical protein
MCIISIKKKSHVVGFCVSVTGVRKNQFRPEAHAPPPQSESSTLVGWFKEKTLELTGVPIKPQIWTSRRVGLVVAGKQNASVAGVKRAESKKQELSSPNHLRHRRFSLANLSLQICAHSTDCCLKSSWMMKASPRTLHLYGDYNGRSLDESSVSTYRYA